MKFVVFGGSGLLGSKICKCLQLKKLDYSVISLRSSNALNWSRLEKQLVRLGTEIIINAAALTNMALCQSNPKKAHKINSLIPEELVNLAKKNDFPIFQISTEAVFPGNIKGKLYEESDTPNPSTVYGKTKLEGERAVLNYKNGVVIRLPRLFDPHQQIIAELYQKIPNGIKVSEDNVSTPIVASLAAEKIVEICCIWSSKNQANKVFHVTGNRRVSMFELLRLLAEPNQQSFIKAVQEGFFSNSDRKGKFLNGGLVSKTGYTVSLTDSVKVFRKCTL